MVMQNTIPHVMLSENESESCRRLRLEGVRHSKATGYQSPIYLTDNLTDKV